MRLCYLLFNQLKDLKNSFDTQVLFASKPKHHVARKAHPKQKSIRLEIRVLITLR